MNLWERGGAVRTRTLMSAASAGGTPISLGASKSKAAAIAKPNNKRIR
jgi:hypothetical protein